MRVGFFRSVVRGWAIGDLTVDFGLERLGPGDVEVSPIHDVLVAVDRRLIELLRRAATVCRRPVVLGGGLDIGIFFAEARYVWLGGDVESSFVPITVGFHF